MSFRREKYIPMGGPNGGDGGKGGDVVFKADENVGDLTAFRFRHNFKARNGEPGKGSDRHGRSGPDLILKLPMGTLILDQNTGRAVRELLKHEERFAICKGGKGGRGNAHFKSSTNRSPKWAQPGEEGESGQFRLVLKIIADIGLVGFPNAGKSSLTNLITKAHPAVADYPFTTLHPHIGVIEYPDIYSRLLLADIPGLTKGASENKGLGHRFLRHIERCKLLCLMVDMAGVDGRNPGDDYRDLISELGNYDPQLLAKPRLVVANKMDEDAAPPNLEEFMENHCATVSPISCLTEEGIPELRQTFLDAMNAFDANAG